jgi:transcriptional regulator with XRE-family HTH domain
MRIRLSSPGLTGQPGIPETAVIESISRGVRMGTSQSTIARLENGQTLPSTKTILRYAEATGSKFSVRLSAA